MTAISGREVPKASQHVACQGLMACPRVSGPQTTSIDQPQFQAAESIKLEIGRF